ncbi:MAG TPA: hypothetical protein VOA87_21710 [Thermoanaerobaculia bacterium]|nr:hypothetical protein [Thermoanaerobaculia bacterium]
MRSTRNSSSQPPDNIFSPSFLALIRERDETLTASEAEFAGPWRTEAVPGRPGAVAVLRDWERLEGGDVPEAIFWHEETALLMAALLPATEREPLFHLAEEDGPDGFALYAIFGEQGNQVAGWLRHYEPEKVEALHLLEAVIRSPVALANLLEAAGPGAIEKAGQILARRME